MCHFYIAVDVLVKLLKRKTFILEKFLDTAFQPPIRFFPESSDGFLNLRWNYSPLKERPSSCRTAFCFPYVFARTPLEKFLTVQNSSSRRSLGRSLAAPWCCIHFIRH